MSLTFLIGFSAGCAAVYYLVPRRFRWLLLLLASLGYYARAGLRGIPFILLTGLSTWLGALQIAHIADAGKLTPEQKKAMSSEEKKAHREQTRRRQRFFFLLVLLLNFGILAVLKYLEPFLDWAHTLSSSVPVVDLLLPLGISFYTFQSMGYLIDVYNGKIRPETNPLRFLLFVTFFPQLIQGPIGRYDQLADQLFKPHSFDLARIERGCLLIIFGFFKKKVLADRALPFVEAVFDTPGQYGGLVIAAAVLLYSLQQYCDFSGGIDLVTGIAELFGIQLAPNFRRPYFSVSLGDFWRRWHISLGAWMRDYVFYPFAVSRPMQKLSKAIKTNHAQLARALPAALGNILVFFLVGIWHGAEMHYVLWGLYNGVILAVSALLEPAYKQFGERHARLTAGKPFHVFRILRTFLIVNIGWYFDRSLHASDAFVMLYRTVAQPMVSQISSGMLLQLGLKAEDWRILFIGVIILFVVSFLSERGKDVRTMLFEMPTWLRFLILILFFYFTLAHFMGEGAGDTGFMYAVF